MKQKKNLWVNLPYKAQMAESVDALVSNTSGATRAGSTPALGTELEKDENLSPFSFLPPRNSLVC